MIVSKENAKVKTWIKYHQKKYRQQDKKFLIEEQHLIEEALKCGIVDTIIILENKEDIYNFVRTKYVSEEIMRKLSHNISLNSYIAVCNIKENKITSNRILLLDDIQNPGNMGSILRSAYAFGYREIYLSKGCVDLYNEKVIQASQGALFYLNCCVKDLSEVIKLKNNFKIYATGFTNAINLKAVEYSEKMGFILGNEGSGVSQKLLDEANDIVKIEMQTFDSLNVGIAGAICMYHFQGEFE